MTVLIFANGDMDEVEWLRPYLDNAIAIIAANGGTRHLMRLGHVPTVIVGDMDSVPAAVRDEFAEAEWQQYPVEKDETDLELALAYAVANYDEEIWVVGALGGRLDQLLANIFLLTHPDWVQAPVKIVSPYQRAWVTVAMDDVVAKLRIEGAVGDTVSLIPLGGDVQVAETVGLKWSLHDEALKFGPARGVSNVLTAKTAVVQIQSGTLLCVHTLHGWER